jgi:hypothetical protein
MKRTLRAASCLAFSLWLGGCSTLTGDFHQKLQIETLDTQNRPVAGMQCQIGSDSKTTVTTPAHDVRGRRSATPLPIRCQRHGQIATATVTPRRERMEEALLPFGSVGVFVDHLSGTLYGYPTTLRLRVGQHLVLEHGGEAQVATSEPIAPPPQPPKAPVPPVEVAALQPAVAVVAVSRGPATAVAQKVQPSSSPKTDRATSKPIKTASAAATTPQPRTAVPQKAEAVLTAARASDHDVHSAPVNW